MAKQILFSEEASRALRRGVQQVCTAVSATLGPRGRAVVIGRSWGAPNVTLDGSTVADEIDLTDPNENLGAKMVKEAASKTSDTAGDGTTTSVVLASAIFEAGNRHRVAGADPMAIARGILKAAQAVEEDLVRLAGKLGDDKQIVQLATVAAGGEREIGKTVADAFDKVGRDGVVNVEEGQGTETEIKVLEGMQFDRGFVSPRFATHPEEMKAVLDKPYILLYEEKLSSVQKLLPLLEQIREAKASLLIVAEDVEGDALATLVVNRLRGILSVCAVKAPGYGDRRKAMLQDIAVLTNGEGIFKDLGRDIETLTLRDLGRARKVIVTAENTTIIGGAGTSKAVRERVDQIRAESEASDSDYDREKLQERIARLGKGIAQIEVGAATETEMKERKGRYEDALRSTRAALEEGVVPGGGVALLRATGALDKLTVPGDEVLGVRAVRTALTAPLRTLVRNAGEDPDIVLSELQGKKKTYGFDVERLEFRDLTEAGILDPVKVTRHALRNAASVAAMLLTTSAIVSDEADAGDDDDDDSEDEAES